MPEAKIDDLSKFTAHEHELMKLAVEHYFEYRCENPNDGAILGVVLHKLRQCLLI